MPCMPRIGRNWFLAATAALLLACDDSTGNSNSIQIALTPAQVLVPQGGTSETTVALTRSGDFAGVVTLSVAGLPAGLAAVITPSQLSGTTATATIAVSVGTFIPPGTASMTIVATAEGVEDATATLSVTITLAPDFRLTVGTNNVTVNTGSTGTTTVNIDRTNFAGAIALQLSNPPAGITGVFDPASPTGNSSQLTLSVAATVTPATYFLTVQGVGAGVGERIALLTINVQAPPGAFTINLSPGAFTLPRGNTAIVNITLARTDYSGPINLVFENPPAGITGTLVPASTTGNTSTFTIAVGDAVAPGLYQLRLRGSATGFIDRIAFVQLNVTAPVGSVVEYLFCDASKVPVFFAYQDGSGTWKTVTPTTVGVLTRFTFTIASGRGGVLMVSQTGSAMVADALAVRRLSTASRPRAKVSGGAQSRLTAHSPDRALLVDQYTTEVMYASADELVQDGTGNCAQTQLTKDVFGTVAGVSTGEIGILSLGGTTAVFTGGVSTNPVLFAGVREGQLDFVGSRTTVGNVPDRVVVFRNLDVPAGGSFPSTIDFNGPASSSPATATATITGSGSDLVEVFTEVITNTGRSLLWFDQNPSVLSMRPWAGLNPATMVAGDFHSLVAFATAPSGDAYRVALKYVGAVADQTLVMGPTINAPTAAQVAAGPYPRYRFQGTIPADYNKGVSVDITRRNEPGNLYSIMASSAWLAAAGNALSFDLTMPDVSGLAGFPAAARLTAGLSDASVSAFGFNGPGVFDLRPMLGTEFKASARTIPIGVPQ